FAASREQFEAILVDLDSPEVRAMTHSDLERRIADKGKELLRQLYQDHLDLRGSSEATASVTGADGITRTSHRPGERNLMTVFGPVVVRRERYYEAAGGGGLHPRDAELNLPPELYSLELRRRAAVEAAKTSFDESAAAIAERTGAEIPKRQVEELVQRAATDFDAF